MAKVVTIEARDGQTPAESMLDAFDATASHEEGAHMYVPSAGASVTKWTQWTGIEHDAPFCYELCIEPEYEDGEEVVCAGLGYVSLREGTPVSIDLETDEIARADRYFACDGDWGTGSEVGRVNTGYATAREAFAALASELL